MPITLGCPSCGKRFRARDESSGKRVRCPYCQAAVPVPTAEQAQHATAPTEEVPAAAHPPAARPAAPVAVADAADWGATPAAAAPRPVVVAVPHADPLIPPPAAKGDRDDRGRGKKEPPPGRRDAKGPAPAKSPAAMAAPHWRKARAGLGWVLVGLFFLLLPGFAEFGKYVYERSGNALPEGPGWVEVEGYVNKGEPGTLKLTKRDEINTAAYLLPVILGGLCLTLGRLTCGAAPRSSGAKGMFVLSSFATLAAVIGLLVACYCFKQDFRQTFRQAMFGGILAFLLSEAWFLAGLSAVGGALKRPRASRAVGLTILVGGVVGALAMVATEQEWEVKTITRVAEPNLPPRADEAKAGDRKDAVEPPVPAGKAPNPKKGGKGGKGGKAAPPELEAIDKPVAAQVPVGEVKPDPNKPQKFVVGVWHVKPGDEEVMYTSAGGMLAWLLLIGVYWRSVGAARWAIRDWLETAEDAA